MYLPFYYKTTIEELHEYLSYLQSSESPEVRDYFRHLHKFSWRIIPRSKPLSDKLTFLNFDDLIQFVKFAYILYPTLCLTLLYQSNETDSTISF